MRLSRERPRRRQVGLDSQAGACRRALRTPSARSPKQNSAIIVLPWALAADGVWVAAWVVRGHLWRNQRDDMEVD